MSDFWGRFRAFRLVLSGFLDRIGAGLAGLFYRMLASVAGQERTDQWLGQYQAVRQRLRSRIHTKFDPSSPYYRPVTRLWKSVLVGFVLVAVYITILETNFLWLSGQMPSVEDLQNPKIAQSSEIYSYDKVLIGKFFTENRTPVDYKDLPPHLINALIATEDVRFYKHAGIDTRSLGRAVFGVLTGNSAGGGSTITQQLAKNLFKTRRKESRGLLMYVPLVRTIVVKSKEWLMAIKLERNFTKEEILTMYFNTVDFGSNAYGIKTAARTYFRKATDSLNVQEAAVLVGLQKATTTYNPLLNPDRSKKRRNIVLEQMAKYGYLTKPQADSLAELPLRVRFTSDNPYAGPANYFKNAVVEVIKQWAKKKEEEDEETYDLYTDGLKIYTTVDSRMQAYAEDAVTEKMKQLQRTFDNHWKNEEPWRDENGELIPDFIDKVVQRTERYKSLKQRFPNQPDSVRFYLYEKKDSMTVFSWQGPRKMYMTPIDSIKYYKRFLQAGMVAMDPHSGFIKAWVGGLDYQYFKYDHVKQGKRQPGSTFKPFVYTTVLDDSTINMSPCDRVQDRPFRASYVENGQERVWEPRNSVGYFSYASLTLRRALARSINSVTAHLTNEVATPARVVDYAQRMGIKSRLAAVPSVGLGSSDVSLYEMVAAYGTFANSGVYTEPLIVTRIEDRNGNLIEEFVPERKQAIREETAFLMLHMLKGGLQEPGGTSQNLWSYDLFAKNNEVGGKTGTTSNNSDGWFIGVTRDLIVGAWVGGDDRSIHFRTTDLGEGAKTALPLVGRFLEKIYADKTLGVYQGPFHKPKFTVTKDYLNCLGGGDESSDDDESESDSTATDDFSADSLLLDPVPTPPSGPPDTTGTRP